MCGLFIAVDCQWGEWSEWGKCPYECDEEWQKLRTRDHEIEASCDGAPCVGEDFEKESCNRVADLIQEVTSLTTALDTCKL